MALYPQQKLGAAVARVTFSVTGWAPYFGCIMQGLVRREMDATMEAHATAVGGAPTVAVTKDGVLYWSRTFVEKSSVEDLAKALMHETMHVLTETHRRTTALGIVPEPSADSTMKSSIANICSDASINEQLRLMLKDVSPIPDWYIVPENIGNPAGLSGYTQPLNLPFETRYHLLLQEMKKQQQGGKSNGTGKTGRGWCGSCAGHPIPGEPPGGGKEARSEAEMDRFRRETAQAIKHHVAEKGVGNVPGDLIRWADELLAPPKVDWTKRLAQAVTHAVAYRPGAVDFDWSRLSRRQSGLGYGIGVPIVPNYRAPVPQVACAIDTSGSVSTKGLGAAISEVMGVMRTTGSTLTLCVVDADVQELRDVASIQEVLPLLRGGGGTDMRPALQALNDRKPRPEVVIVMTDGAIPHPGEAPPYRVVWVIIEGSPEFTAPFGEVVHVDLEQGA